MNESMETILFEALDLMEQGASIDEIVARYPEQAAELRPFLMTATALSSLATQPTLTAQAQSRRAFLAAAEQAVVVRSRPAAVTGGRLRRLMLPFAAVLAVLFLGGAGLARTSGSAVPGDALYETKRLVEDVRLNLTGDPELAAELRDQFRQERVREIEQLLAGDRVAEVSLTGAIESMAGDRWTVAGVAVIVAGGTVIDGVPLVGAVVQVDGRTGANGVAADRVMVLSAPSLPDATPNPEPAVTPPSITTPSMTTPTRPRPETTVTVDDDNDNGDDDTPGSGGAALPAPSLTTAPPEAPAPTATPADGDNANDNGDDNGDDNANDNGDDNANDNGDDNANDNGDDNANDNGDENDDNGDDNNDSGGNDNDNANDNGDDSGGDNGNGGGGDG